MVDNFQTAKASIYDLSSEMIELLRASLNGVVFNLHKLKVEKSIEQNRSASRNKALSFVSIASLITGGIGVVCGATWAKWLLILGAGGVGIDYCISRKITSIGKNSSFGNTESQSIPLSERYKIIESLGTFSDAICENWNNKLDSIKESLLKSVADSDASEDNKVKANYELYVVNRINYSMTDWLPRFEAAGDKSHIVDLISQYGAYFTGQIEEAYNKQSLAYIAAENILKVQR